MYEMRNPRLMHKENYIDIAIQSVVCHTQAYSTRTVQLIER